MPHSAARPLLLGAGVHIPEPVITNAELVESFNAWVATENQGRAARGEPPQEASDAAFIVKASGVCQRHVLEKSGILDPARMVPRLPERANEEISILAEIGVAAARAALTPVQGRRIDAVICAASNMQRRLSGHGHRDAAGAGHERLRLRHERRLFLRRPSGSRRRPTTSRPATPARFWCVNPEITSGHLNFRDRDSHFIFGDVATAVIVERRRRGAAAAGTSWARGSRPSSPTTSATTSAFSTAPRRTGSPRSTSFSCRKAARCSRRSCRWSAR